MKKHRQLKRYWYGLPMDYRKRIWKVWKGITWQMQVLQSSIQGQFNIRVKGYSRVTNSRQSKNQTTDPGRDCTKITQSLEAKVWNKPWDLRILRDNLDNCSGHLGIWVKVRFKTSPKLTHCNILRLVNATIHRHTVWDQRQRIMSSS